MSGPELIVRKCSGCGSPSAVSVRNYQQTVLLGLVQTGRSMGDDFVCQRCGLGFHARGHGLYWMLLFMFSGPFTLLGVYAFVGGLIASLAEGNLEALVFGLVCGSVTLAAGLGSAFLLWRPIATLRASPIVPGAPAPPMRFFRREPIRRCTCGYPVRCHEVVSNNTSGIPTGMEYRYACHVCDTRFTIESPGEMVFSFAGGAFLTAIGVFFASGILEITWFGWSIAVFLALIGGGAIALSLARLGARYRHPVIPGSFDEGA